MASKSRPSYTSYKILSFDIFGTIIDQELGFYQYLSPLVSQLPDNHPFRASFPNAAPAGSRLAPRHPLMVAFKDEEAKLLAAYPHTLYEDLLRNSYFNVAKSINLEAKEKDADALANSIGAWPPFPDSIAAMQILKKHFKLVALSNISNAAIAKVLSGPLSEVAFDAVYTAEDIGSYKPAKQNFEFLLSRIKEEFGASKEDLVHVAHGFQSDQIRPEEMGIVHVWVERGVDNRNQAQMEAMKFVRTVADLKELADIVEQETEARDV